MSDTNSTYTYKNDIELELNNLWSAFKRRWHIGLLVIIFSIVLSAIAASKQKSEYTATGKLLFKINRAAVIAGIGEELNNLNALEHNANPVITEIEVVKSFPIAEQTVANLEESKSVGSSLSAEEIINKLSVETIIGTDIVTVSYTSESAKRGTNVVNELMKTYIDQMLENNRNDILAAEQIVNEQLPKARARVNEKEAAVQAFKEKYQIFAFDRESQDVISNANNIENEINNVRVELQQAQSRANILKEQLGMNSQQALALNNISQSPKVQQAVKNLSQLQNEILQKQEFLKDTNPTMISLYNQVESLENFLENEINKVPNSTDKQFTIADLQSTDENNIQQQLIASLAELEQTKSGLEKKLTQLQDIQQKYQLSLRNLPKIENEYKDLQLQLEAAQSNYQSLLKSIEEIRSVEQQNFNNVRIVEYAQVQESNRQSVIVLSLGTALGIIIAIFTMIVLEVTDKSIKTIERLKELFNYPILGTIPTVALEIKSSSLKKFVDKSVIQYLPKSFEKDRLEPVNDPKPIYSEESIIKLSSQEITPSLSNNSYSMLHARFKIIAEKQSVNTIAISSSLPQEGKSEITANLASTIANSGQTVLIIDANLHQPSQQRIWQLEHDEGLTDVIIDGKMSDLFIHRVSNNLDVLLAGKNIKNPYDVINSQTMKLLVEGLSQKYDYVLIDSPSLIDNVDALNLGKISDGILLVIKLGVLNNSQAIECKNLLEMTEQNVIGIVVNEFAC